MCSAMGEVVFFFLNLAPLLQSHPSCSALAHPFYISTLAITTAENSALSIVDQQGRVAHEHKSKAYFISRRAPEGTEANANVACLLKHLLWKYMEAEVGPFVEELC